MRKVNWIFSFRNCETSCSCCRSLIDCIIKNIPNLCLHCHPVGGDNDNGGNGSSDGNNNDGDDGNTGSGNGDNENSDDNNDNGGNENSGDNNDNGGNENSGDNNDNGGNENSGDNNDNGGNENSGDNNDNGGNENSDNNNNGDNGSTDDNTDNGGNGNTEGGNDNGNSDDDNEDIRIPDDGIMDNCYIEGYNLGWRSAENFQQCHNYCLSFDGCDIFEYNRDKKYCLLKPYYAKKDIKCGQACSIIGFRCSIKDANEHGCIPNEFTSCYLLRKSYMNPYYVTENSEAETVEDCQNLCGLEPDCEYFTFDFDSNKCSFFKYAVIDPLYSDRFVSGPKSCGNRNSIRPIVNLNKENTLFSGTLIKKPETTVDAIECQGRCQLEPNCNFFTFNKSKNSENCYFLSSIQEIFSDENFVSGLKYPKV